MQVLSHDEIIFEAGEDLYNQTKSKLVFQDREAVPISIYSHSRIFSSYCNEFCGRTGLSFKLLKFEHSNHQIKPETVISDACCVIVQHKPEFHLEPPNSLKNSLIDMMNLGMFSDIILNVSLKGKPNNEMETFKAHKCILGARSPVLLTSQCSLEENEPEKSNLDFVFENERCQEAFKFLLQYIYIEELKFPDNLIDIFSIMQISHIYQVADQVDKCEEVISDTMDCNNVMDLLMQSQEHPIISEDLGNKCQKLFQSNYDKIAESTENIEEKISKQPGLMSKLFMFNCSKNIKQARKQVSFVDKNNSDIWDDRSNYD